MKPCRSSLRLRNVRSPVILVVDSDPDALATVEGDLRRRYEGTFRVATASSEATALEACARLSRQSEPVALVLAADELPGRRGAAFLAEARVTHPDAARALLTSQEHVEAAMLAVNELGVHRYLTKPCQPPEELLYPAVDELLADWRARDSTPRLAVEAIMDTGGNVVRIGHDATLYDAAQIVAASRVGDLMVVDDGGRFLGVLSEGDILRNALPDFDEIVEAGGTLHDAFQLFVRKAQELAAKPIAPLVIRDPIVMAPDDHVAQAATILVERQIRRLPVVDDGRLAGTVSRANVCHAVVASPPATAPATEATLR